MGIRRLKGFILLAALLFSGISCDSRRFFEENKNISEGKWNVNNRVSFSVVIQDTAASYNFYLNVRNDLKYSYSNLYLFLKTQFPDRQVARDTIECQLAGYDGRWLGTGMGSVRFNRFLFQQGVHFRQKGTYVFEFEQAMRVAELSGIRDIGIRIEKD
jgi:gliding motility-associated lipoprotein GldH